MDKTNVRAEFRIMGDELRPQEVTEALGLEPSETWCRGDPIRGTSRHRTYASWGLYFAPEETLDIQPLLEKIESTFLPKTEAIRRLRSRFDIEISVDLVIVIEDAAPPGACFEPRFLKLLSDIGARLDLDMYIN